MGDQGLTQAPRHDGGWAETGMRWLGRVTQVVEVSLAWWLTTALGLILLGHLPASVAAVSVLGRLGTDEASDRPLADFFGGWRANLLRSNAVGWPATVALLILGLNAWVLSRGTHAWMAPMLVATICVGAWLVLAVAYLVVFLADERTRGLPALRLWRAALAVPLTSPATAAAWLVCVLSLAVVTWRFTILLPLAVPGLLALLTAWLMRRRLDQTGLLTAVD